MFEAARDPFFLITVGGAFLGLTGGIASHRFSRRSRPVAFRRRRRHAIPLLLLPVVVLVGFGFILGSAPLVEWWPCAAALFVVPAGFIGAALGLPGRWAVLPLRLVLVALLAAVPLSGLLFHHPELVRPGKEVTLRVSAGGNSAHEHLEVTIGVATPASGNARLRVSSDDVLLVTALAYSRIPPLWWMPAAGTVIGLDVAVPDSGERLEWKASSRGPLDMRETVEQLLSNHGLLTYETPATRVPSRMGLFLQPGHYHFRVTPHPVSLMYRYTHQ